MRIERNFLSEYLKELRSSSQESEALQTNPELSLLFVKALAEAREKFRAEKRAAGLCMTASEFNELAKRTQELAEIYDMDLLAEQSNCRARLILTSRGFDLSRGETPERVELLALLLSRADRLFIQPVSKYNESLIELAMLYDLDE